MYKSRSASKKGLSIKGRGINIPEPIRCEVEKLRAALTQ
jgi:hypothetical protein